MSDSSRLLPIYKPTVDSRKKLSVMKLDAAEAVLLNECKGAAKLSRENNFKEFKSANNVGIHPTSGAGSEYGREAKEEARRKRLGIRSQTYDPDKQPWMLEFDSKLGPRKQKGTKCGTLTSNASYYVIEMLEDNKRMHIHPIEEWVEFKSVPTYATLNSEESESAYANSNNTHNYYALMYSKKANIKKGDDENNEDGAKKAEVKTNKPRHVGSAVKKSKKKPLHKRMKRMSDDEDDEGLFKSGDELEHEDFEPDDWESMSEGEENVDDEAANDTDAGVAEGKGFEEDDKAEFLEEEKEEEEKTKNDDGMDENNSEDSSDLENSSEDENELSGTNKQQLDGSEPKSKKQKLESSEQSAPKNANNLEQLVRKWLSDSHLTPKDLFKKLVSKESPAHANSKEENVQILKEIANKLKLYPKKINGTTYLFLPVN